MPLNLIISPPTSTSQLRSHWNISNNLRNYVINFYGTNILDLAGKSCRGRWIRVDCAFQIYCFTIMLSAWDTFPNGPYTPERAPPWFQIKSYLYDSLPLVYFTTAQLPKGVPIFLHLRWVLEEIVLYFKIYIFLEAVGKKRCPGSEGHMQEKQWKVSQNYRTIWNGKFFYVTQKICYTNL